MEIKDTQLTTETPIKSGVFIVVPKDKTIEEAVQEARWAAIKEVAELYHMEMARIFEEEVRKTPLVVKKSEYTKAAARHKNYAADILNQKWLEGA